MRYYISRKRAYVLVLKTGDKDRNPQLSWLRIFVDKILQEKKNPMKSQFRQNEVQKMKK